MRSRTTNATRRRSGRSSGPWRWTRARRATRPCCWRAGTRMRSRQHPFFSTLDFPDPPRSPSPVPGIRASRRRPARDSGRWPLITPKLAMRGRNASGCSAARAGTFSSSSRSWTAPEPGEAGGLPGQNADRCQTSPNGWRKRAGHGQQPLASWRQVPPGRRLRPGAGGASWWLSRAGTGRERQFRGRAQVPGASGSIGPCNKVAAPNVLGPGSSRPPGRSAIHRRFVVSARVSMVMLAFGLTLASPVLASDVGYLYGRVETVDGGVYEGQLRWGTEESFWDDLFNANKFENENIAYV